MIAQKTHPLLDARAFTTQFTSPLGRSPSPEWLTGLVCLFDAEGPCANAVKDAQRTKTHSDTAHRWYRELLARAGATTEDEAISAG